MNDPAIPLSALERKIITSCSVKPLGVKEMAQLFSIDYASGDMKRAITRLLQLQLIEYVVPEYNRSYAQRYRTTQKGKKYLQ